MKWNVSYRRFPNLPKTNKNLISALLQKDFVEFLFKNIFIVAILLIKKIIRQFLVN